MKNYIKFLLLSLLVYSCGDFEPVIYDDANVAIGFQIETTNAVINPNGNSITIPVQSTNRTSTDRSFNVAVDNEFTTANALDYTLSTINIPANEFEGELIVQIGNYENLPDLVTRILVLNLDLPDNVGVIGSKTTTISYVKAVVCNDLTLTLNEDGYADERDWSITDSDGEIVVECSDYSDCPAGAESGSLLAAQYVYNFNLLDGCYTFTITDSYADGQSDGTITGNYELSCAVITHASGEGNWGAEQSTEFCVNPE